MQKTLKKTKECLIGSFILTFKYVILSYYCSYCINNENLVSLRSDFLFCMMNMDRKGRYK